MSGKIAARVQTAWDAAGLNRITLHECRHTYASLLMAAGYTIKELMEFMGHADLQMVNRYVKLLPQPGEDDAAQRLNDYLRRSESADLPRSGARPGTTPRRSTAIALMTPSERVALAIEISRAALLFAHAGRAIDVTPTFEPDQIVAALNRADVAYVIVGALAGAAHGVVRATPDLDLVPEPSASNLERLAHPHGLGPSLGRPLLVNASRIEFRTRHGDVHVLNRTLGVPPHGASARARDHGGSCSRRASPDLLVPSSAR